MTTHRGMLLILVLWTSLLVAGCAVLAPQFTTIDRIITLQPGMTYDQVTLALGILPYDVYLGQEDGTTVYSWQYKHLERLEVPERLATRDGMASGRELLVKPSWLYGIFVEGKLVSFTTDAGLDGTPAVLCADVAARRIWAGEAGVEGACGAAADPAGGDSPNPVRLLRKNRERVE